MKNAKVEITTIAESQWKLCRDLRLEALKESPLAFSASHEEEEGLSESTWRARSKNALFAMDQGIPVGMIVLMRRDSQKTRHIANIFGLYVKTSHRGQGFGNQLLNGAIQKLKAVKHLEKIKLTVVNTQKQAIDLYKKFEFQEVGILKNELYHQGKFYDELVMERYLKQV